MTPLNAIVEALVCRLGQADREAFEERAGIMEFEAGKPRELAECLALLDVLRTNPLGLLGLSAIRVEIRGEALLVLATDAERLRQHLVSVGGKELGPADLTTAVEVLGGVAQLAHLRRPQK